MSARRVFVRGKPVYVPSRRTVERGVQARRQKRLKVSLAPVTLGKKPHFTG